MDGERQHDPEGTSRALATRHRKLPFLVVIYPTLTLRKASIDPGWLVVGLPKGWPIIGSVACLHDDLDQLFTCRHYKFLARAPGRSHPSGRRFRELRRRTRPMGALSERTAMDRILFAVPVTKTNQGVSIP